LTGSPPLLYKSTLDTIGKSTRARSVAQDVGLALGVILFIAFLTFPFDADPRMRRVAAIAALMAVWWMTEALPLAATSLMPLVLMPLSKIAEPDTVARAYMNDYIFLFVGGFVIALAMERWGLHRRLALYTIRLTGDRPRQVVLGFMIATAGLSMWISNSATAMMMLPIALSVVSLARERKEGLSPDAQERFGIALMLSIAYAASIGGIATLIGTPPNVVFASRFHDEFPGAPEVTFTAWLMVGVPFSAVFLVLAWALIVFLLHPVGGGRLACGREALRNELIRLGPMTRAELGVLAVFLCAAFLWIFRVGIPLEIHVGPIRVSRIPGWSELLGLANGKVRWVSDGTVAMMAALSMFLIPSGRQRGERLVDWKTIRGLPWDILFLFGGGFALADGLVASGLSDWIGRQSRQFGQLPLPAQILGVSGLVTFLTELTSNTATANIVLPVLAGVARAIEVNPLALMLPATVSASCAFMLPVATPPNAIVFGSGLVPIGAMVRTGLWLNFIGMGLVLLWCYFVALPLWGVDPGHFPPSWLRSGN